MARNLIYGAEYEDSVAAALISSARDTTCTTLSPRVINEETKCLPQDVIGFVSASLSERGAGLSARSGIASHSKLTATLPPTLQNPSPTTSATVLSTARFPPPTPLHAFLSGSSGNGGSVGDARCYLNSSDWEASSTTKPEAGAVETPQPSPSASASATAAAAAMPSRIQSILALTDALHAAMDAEPNALLDALRETVRWIRPTTGGPKGARPVALSSEAAEAQVSVAVTVPPAGTGGGGAVASSLVDKAVAANACLVGVLEEGSEARRRLAHLTAGLADLCTRLGDAAATGRATCAAHAAAAEMLAPAPVHTRENVI